MVKSKFFVAIFLLIFTLGMPKPALAKDGQELLAVLWMLSAGICGTSIWALVSFKNCEKQSCFDGDNLLLCDSAEQNCNVVQARDCKDGGSYKTGRVFCVPKGQNSPANAKSVTTLQDNDLPPGAMGAAIAGSIIGGLSTILIPLFTCAKCPAE